MFGLLLLLRNNLKYVPAQETRKVFVWAKKNRPRASIELKAKEL